MSSSSRVLLQTCVFVHGLDHVSAVGLGQLRDVDIRDTQRDQHLDDELVTWGARGVGRAVQPGVELGSAGVSEAVAVLPAALRGVVGLDELVSLEALEGRVHLAGVQWPHLAGAGLEFLSELKAVLWTLAEQGQQRMSDHHARYTTE